jgi:hypothetical protein
VHNNKSHGDQFQIIQLRTGDDKKFKQFLYANVHYLIMGQWGPEHEGIDVLKHYYDSNEPCTSVDLRYGNWIIMHGMENVIIFNLRFVDYIITNI